MADRDNSGNLIIPISVGDEVLKPSERPVLGTRRLVRLIPTPLGSRPALWTSPYETMERFEGGVEKARKIVVLLNRPSTEEPVPEIAVITIPSAAIDKFPLVPVEW